MSSTTNRYIWIDALRLIAGLSMVTLHATADAHGQPYPDHSAADRLWPMVIRSLCYVARTELFIIVSIFLLLLALEKRPQTYGGVMTTQSRRLLVPFAFWTLFYAFYSLLKAQQFGYGTAALQDLFYIETWAGFFALGNVKYHMHFIPTLFGVLLFYPLYKIAYRHPTFGIGVVLCLLLKRELDLIIYPQFWGQEILPYIVRLVKILTYTGYGLFAASMLALWHHTSITMRRNWIIPIVLIGLALCLIKAIATWKTIQTGQWPFDYTPGYWADFIMPMVLFAIVMCLRSDSWTDLITKWVPYSFGIYLTHPIFLDLAEVMLQGRDVPPFQSVMIECAITLPCTLILVRVIATLPFFAWTIGLGSLPRFFPSAYMFKRK